LKGQELATTPLGPWRALRKRHAMGSGGSAAGHGCCSPFSTVPGFHYDQPSLAQTRWMPRCVASATSTRLAVETRTTDGW